jgi:hypothetical protein
LATVNFAQKRSVKTSYTDWQLQLQEQYISNAQGDRMAVILDITAYQKLIEEMDEFLCWKGYQQAVEEIDLELANGDFATLDNYLATEAQQVS